MGKRKFSGLEITLMVLFVLVGIVAIALVVLLATGEPAVTKEPTNPTQQPDPEPEPFVPVCPDIPIAERVECHPEAGASQQRCLARGCCWSPLDQTNVPWCFFSSNSGYTVVSQNRADGTRLEARLKRVNSPSLYGAEISELSFTAEMQTENRLRFKITDINNSRFEVPHEHVKSLTSSPNGPLNYELELVHNPFGVRVRRVSNRKILFDTTVAPLVFEDQFLQISAKLASDNIYGLGEHVHQNYRHDVNWRTWPIFTRDSFPNGGTHNIYGHYPFFMCLETDRGESFGVFLMNSNAMDVTLQPAPAVTYRTIGGVLDFYIMLGGTPEAIVQEFTELVGRPTIPPYWAFGFQLSRWDYGSLEELKRTVERNREIGLPYDTQYTDIDYMEDKKDFTYDMVKFKDLPQFADYMHQQGQRYILILDPAIAISKRINGTYESYDRGTQVEAWITEADGTTPLVGEDMNEPASFVHGTVGGKCLGDDIYENPPYMPPLESKHMGLNHKTLCMNSEQSLPDGTPVKHYDVHNLYGWSHTKPTYDALLNVTGVRGIVVTRSTYPTSGQWAGHWLGDNNASWDQLYKSIIGMLEFSLFGISYTGADICGFFNEAEYEMCLRWMQLGAFYPYSRNHNGKGNKRQDPVAWDATFAEASRDVLNIRYTLLPYLYTLMYEAHAEGSTVVRPLLHEFVNDKVTWDIHRQFLWGPALLISPALEKGETVVSAYVPNARWYDYHTARALDVRGQFVNMPTPLNKINLHVRGGHILPWQKPENNTFHSRKNPLGLIVALGDDGTARGSLFWDDGEGIDTDKSGQYLLLSFGVFKNTLTSTLLQNGLDPADRLRLGHVRVWGTGSIPITKVSISYPGESGTLLNFYHDAVTEELIIDATSGTYFVDQHFTISWSTGL
ncbi:hypothetical protein AOLI_G00092910 [Acnodon oligacanthus]